MTYANIKLQSHVVYDENNQPTGEKQQSVIFDLLVPLIEGLALKYPHWEFVEDNSRVQWGDDGRRYMAADEFRVFEKREELGRIRVDHWCRAGKRFWISNFRIKEQKSRGAGVKTKHLSNAMKYVSKYFGAKDHTEIMATAEERAIRVKGEIMGSLSSTKHSHWRMVESSAAAYLLDQWEDFKVWAEKRYPNIKTPLAKYPEAASNLEETKLITKAIDDGTAYLVKIVNSDYIVKQGLQVSVLDSESLPATVRRNLGMLKLVQDEQLISNVGVRVDESTYYVMGDAA